MAMDRVSANGEFLSQAIERCATSAQQFNAPSVWMVADRAAWSFFTQI
jgi:hypothetical protein